MLAGHCGIHMHEQDVPVPTRVCAGGYRVTGCLGDNQPGLLERDCQRLRVPGRTCHADGMEGRDKSLSLALLPSVILLTAADWRARGGSSSVACGRRGRCCSATAGG